MNRIAPITVVLFGWAFTILSYGANGVPQIQTSLTFAKKADCQYILGQVWANNPNPAECASDGVSPNPDCSFQAYGCFQGESSK